MSASDFFYRNRDIAGLSNPSRSIFVAIREAVENSLDAAESQKFLRIFTCVSHLSLKQQKTPKSISFGLKTMAAVYRPDSFLQRLVKYFMAANTS